MFHIYSRILTILIVFTSLTTVAYSAPTVSTTLPTAGSAISSITSVSITFSEAVAGVDVEDLLINGENATSVSGSGAGPYVFSFTQPAPGVVSLSWDFDHGIAGIGTGAFIPESGWQYTLTDVVAPTVAKILSSVAGQELDAIRPLPGSTVGVLAKTQVTFSEIVSGVDAADLLINGVPATGVAGEGAGPYVFEFPQPATGTVNFSWAAGNNIRDTSPAANAFSGNTWTVTLSSSGPGNLVITEFLTANATSIADENGDQPGWIEIFNPGPGAVSLAGWSLTNDEDDPGMWTFPSRSLAANSYLVVRVSGKNRKPASGNLHTNFKLNPSGEFLALVTPNFPHGFASQFNPFPPQRYDYSYGTQAGGGLRYFARQLPVTIADSRPGTANPASTLSTITVPPNFSVSRGFFKDPFQLIISSPDSSAVIRYTLDGSEPIVSSPVYSGALNITGTTLVRAAAFSGNAVPSQTVTHSYIFPEQVFTQPSPPYDNPTNPNDNSNPALPTVGGVTFPISWGTGGGGLPGLISNLPSGTVPADYGMDPEVYNSATKYADNGTVDNVNGKTNRERIQQGFRDLPILSVVMTIDDMFGPNGIHPKSTQKSPPVEKACSLELLLPDGGAGFATMCGIRPHGNASRNPDATPKKGFTLKFKGDFGADDLEYKLFPDSPVQKLDDIVLRADYNTSWLHRDATQRARATRQRDAWAKETFRDMGRAAGRHRYVNLFINGLYWGLYDLTEQQNDTYAENYFGGDNGDYDVIEQGALKSGTATRYNAMLNTILPSTIDNNRYEQVKQHLDVPWFIDYMLLHFFEGHEDWGADINKNWYAIRNAAKNGTFKYLPWDQENLLYDVNVNQLNVTAPPSGLHPKLRTNVQYKLDFADRVHRHMVAPDGALLPEKNIVRWVKWKELLKNAIVGESARWGDYRRDVHVSGTLALYTWNVYLLAEHNRIITQYFPARTNIVLGQLRSGGLYPTLNAPEIRNNATSAILASNRINAGLEIKLTLPNPAPSGTTSAGTIYYTTDGSDPRVYYAGTVAAAAQEYSAPITINATTTIKARVLNNATWSALNEVTFTVGTPLIPPVRISEIMYNPQGGGMYEYLEFANTGTQPVDMSGWSVDGVEFVFPVDTVLGPGGRLVIASNDDPTSWGTRYPGVLPLGYFGGSLDNTGEPLVLRDARGAIVDSVEYGDRGQWPKEADGSGFSLELANLNSDSDVPSNWKPSNTINGSPGLENGSRPASAIELSEVMVLNNVVSNAGLFSPYIELRNNTGEAVDVSNWKLETGGMFVLPSGTTIPANGRLVVWLDNATGGTGLHTSLLSLNAKLGTVLLYSPLSIVPVDVIGYHAQVLGKSIGRAGGPAASWVLTQPSPGDANSAAPLAPASNLVLNEWLANLGPNDLNDWVELHNTSSTLPAAIQGLYLRTNDKLARIPYLGFIAPGGFLQLQLGEQFQTIDLTLPAEGTLLELLDSNGDVQNSVTVSPLPPGVSEGRFPDGTANFFSFGYNTTPGASNVRITNYTGPILNELLAVNRLGELAPWGERAPWVELFNPGGAEFDLSGYALYSLRMPDSPDALRFPNGTKIPAQGYLTVWLSLPSAGTSAPEGTLMTNALPATNTRGSLYLFDTGNRVVDAIEWGNQIPDMTIGRAGNVWKLLAARTRNGANSAPATLGVVSSLKLNEWLAAPASGSDFIELYNGSESAVELSGLYLTDNPSNSGLTKNQIAPLSYIAPKAWASFSAAEVTAEAFRATVPFSLSTLGEYLRLSGADLSLIDAVSFGAQTVGFSEGRILDGQGIAFGLTPTPGGRNILLPAPSITTDPSDRTVSINGSASFTVAATGSAPLTFQWLFNGSPITGATASTLNVTDITLAQDGRYSCVVSNSAGSATSAVAHLIVQTTLADWRSFFFNATEQGNQAISGAAADPDGDGISNLLEFFHGLNPRDPASALDRDALPVVAVEPPTGTPQFVTLTFRRSLRALSLTPELQVSPTLAPDSWVTTTPAVVDDLGVDPTTGDHRVRWKVPVTTGETSKFLRLQLTQ